MFKNYLKTAYRNLQRHKLFSLLNILGLATGMACSILIFLWVQDEKSFDSFNHNTDHIFRLTSNIGGEKAATVPPAFAYAIKNAIPSIQNATRIKQVQKMITVGTQKFDEKNIFYADSNFLQIFNYPLLRGNAATVLASPNSVVLTEATAQKYFGNAENAMGKIIYIDNDIKGTNLTVAGILQNVPANSHLKFDLLVSMELYDRVSNPEGNWRNFDLYTYFQVKNNIEPTPSLIRSIEHQLNLYCKKNAPEVEITIAAQALPDIHLRSSHYMLDVEGQGNYQHVRIFSFVALFIVLIACINFMNLSTAVSGQRAKEVGLRKTVGALRGQLIAQFMGESLMLAFISLALGVVLVYLFLPLFNQLASKSISLNLLNIKLLLSLLVVAIGTGLLSGSYPAFFLSSFNAVKALKGIRLLQGNKSALRNGLVILQFSISVILAIGTLVVYNQLHYMRNKNIGFNKENLLYIKLPAVGDLKNNKDALKNILSQHPEISSYTFTDELPANLTSGSQMTWQGMPSGTQAMAFRLRIDENFTQTFGMQMLAGRFFSKQLKGDDTSYVINEAALKAMNLRPEEAIGKIISISLTDHPAPIIGVIKDFNFKPLQQPVEPLVMYSHFAGGYVVMRTTPANLQKIIGTLKAGYKDVYGDYPFSYGFVDEDLSKLYVSEVRMGNLLNVFSILSIFISCLGLFGLATFATQRRIKEIGIRKVLGAGEVSIVALLSKDFLKLVAFSFFISFPIAWWLMNKWLDNFAYRIHLDAWIFILAGAAALLLALLTVSSQAIKAALANPVKSLKTE